MILHISRDEKFIDSAIEIFESASPGNNKYVVWQQDDNESLPSLAFHFDIDRENYIYSVPKKKLSPPKTSNFVKKNLDHVQVSYYASVHFFKLIGDVKKYKAIVFHSLVYNHAKLALVIKKNFDIPMIWSPFGYEVYNMLPEFKHVLYLEKTKALNKSLGSIKRTGLSILNYFKAKQIRKAMLQMDYCALAIDNEFELYQRVIGIKAQQKWFSYYPIDHLISQTTKGINANNILVGNSSSASNNHLEAFTFLSRFELDNRNIIVPLSYGDKLYGDLIVEKGEEAFPNQFHPLRTFLAIDEYNALIASCSIVIMNHSRQEAFGNILSAIVFGATVYLNERNTIYQYLQKIGVKVLKIETPKGEQNKLKELLPEELNKNREIIIKHFSFKNIVEQTSLMLKGLKD